MKHGRAAAMTLVELLVVIVIMGVLLALLLPAAGNAWDTYRLTQCAVNLRAVYQAFNTFALSDMVRDTAAESRHFPDADFWPAIPYVVCDDASIFTCPQAEFAFAGGGASGESEGDPGGEYEDAGPAEPTAPEDDNFESKIEKYLARFKYVHRVRGFEVAFNDGGHRGLGHMNLGTRYGQDGRGKYIEIGMDDNAPITEGTFADGHDGIIRIYEDNDGNIIARLVKYSCGELNCVLYDGEPAFTSPSDPPYVTNPSDKGFGHLGPGATKNGLERQLDAEEEQTDLQKALASAYGPDGPQAWVLRMGFSTYGMTRGAEKFTTGQEKPLVLDYCRRIVEPTDPNLAPLLLRGARHGGRINVLFTDGRVDTLGPADLDPLMPGNRDLWKP